MSARLQPLSHLIACLIGPIVWAAHFFAVYLAEAVLCAPSVASDDTVVRLAAAGLTMLAIALLLWARLRSRSDRAEKTSGASFVMRPLIHLSIVAVLWTSLPLFVIQACTAAGG